MFKVTRVLGPILLTAVVSNCVAPVSSSEQEQTTGTTEQALSPLDVIKEVIGVGKGLYDYINAGRQDEELRRLNDKMDILESRIKAVQLEVLNLSYWIDWFIHDRKLNAVNQIRSGVLSSVTIHNDKKAMGSSSNEDETILRLANQIKDDSTFYSFPGRAARMPDRFDHRFAIPTFIFAVDAWFAVRKSTGKAWNDAIKTNARQWATHLDWVASQIEVQVYCIRVKEGGSVTSCGGDYKVSTNRANNSSTQRPPPCYTTAWCTESLECQDNIVGNPYTAWSRISDTYCASSRRFDAPATALIIQETYNPQLLREHAARWRTMIPS